MNLRDLADASAKILTAAGLGQKRCANCRSPFFPANLPETAFSRYFCEDCLKILAPFAGLRCQLCGAPLGMEQEAPEPARQSKKSAKICVACLRRPPPWQSLAFSGLYSGSLRDIILRLKFDGELSLARPLAAAMLEAAACLHKPDLLVPVPQHPGGLYKRGYNQAAELAKAIAKNAGFVSRPRALVRVRSCAPQESLTAAQRRVNLVNAFAANRNVAGAIIWVIDDVLTTGSTAREAARALIAAGSSRVCLLIAARTPIE